MPREAPGSDGESAPHPVVGEDASTAASLSRPDSLPTDRSFLDDALATAEAAGFVAVGDCFDADLRYLTRVAGPPEPYAYIRVDGEDVVCPPESYVERAAARFDGRVDADRVGDPPGVRAAAVLDDRVGDGASGTVLVPPTIPHDAAVYLERAGYELQSTAAVGTARATKAPGEVAAIRSVQRAAGAGLRRAERLLAAAECRESDGSGETPPTLRWNDASLTVGRLRRAVNAELAARGVRSAGNTAVSVGTDSDRAATPQGPAATAPSERPLRAGEPVSVAVAPRGPQGYHGTLARTFVVDSDGGWERRAHVAVDAALDAARSTIEPGATTASVAREADAELAAFGFGPAGNGGDGAGSPRSSVHGVGLERREAPGVGGATELEPGAVVAATVEVSDADRGCIRLCDLVAITDDGCELLADVPRAFVPRE